MPDLTIECSDCKQPFVVTEKEQAFLSKTFKDAYRPPKRCKSCRDKRKPRDEPAVDAMPAAGTKSGRFQTDQPNEANKPRRERRRKLQPEE